MAFFEAIRPEIRQYLVDTDEVPVLLRARNVRSFISEKNVLDLRPFELEGCTSRNTSGINHSLAPAKIVDHDFASDRG
jgi:hypothetical protein